MNFHKQIYQYIYPEKMIKKSSKTMQSNQPTEHKKIINESSKTPNINKVIQQKKLLNDTLKMNEKRTLLL
jgi:hypothetical protein